MIRSYRPCTKCSRQHNGTKAHCERCAARTANKQHATAEHREVDQAALVAGRKALFLDTLIANGGHVELACRAAGITRPTIGKYRDEDLEFAAQWEAIQDTNVELLEREVDRRALGYEKPLVYQGKLTGEAVVEYSDTLLMFRLKALRPEKYRDGPGVKPGTQLSEEELDAALTKMMARRGAKAASAPEPTDAVN